MSDDQLNSPRETAEVLPQGTREVLRFARDFPEIFEEIHTAVASRVLDSRIERRSPDYVKTLRLRYADFQRSHVFTPGDLVTWKAGLRNKARPDYDEPAVVLQQLSKPVYNQRRDPGSPYFREPLDLVLGILDEDHELIQFYFDSRRFHHAEERDAE